MICVTALLVNHSESERERERKRHCSCWICAGDVMLDRKMISQFDLALA